MPDLTFPKWSRSLAVGLAAFLGVYFVYLTTLEVKSQSILSELEERRGRLFMDEEEVNAVVRSEEGLEPYHQQLKKELEKLSKVLPESLDLQDPIAEMEKLAAALGLELEVVEIGPVKVGEFFRFQSTEFLIRGPWDSVVQLPEEILKRTPLCKVTWFSLSWDDMAKAEASMELTSYLEPSLDEEEL